MKKRIRQPAEIRAHNYAMEMMKEEESEDDREPEYSAAHCYMHIEDFRDLCDRCSSL